ncbi:MAG: hypothetical protein E6K80_03425 [Candidatus Eisenbacteria bacterium]|uniref:Uncharacterized protein n=1 Tax=Eiseniibacteriota bacterium TaxID=2212470 RepID=A0A538U8X7_UNCEI|nr:MAG: hypothetical protein E6K80_03425 [Candidatus Eisenbacteria bacterium]
MPHGSRVVPANSLDACIATALNTLTIVVGSSKSITIDERSPREPRLPRESRVMQIARRDNELSASLQKSIEVAESLTLTA